MLKYIHNAQQWDGVLMGYEFKLYYEGQNLIFLVYLCSCRYNFI